MAKLSFPVIVAVAVSVMGVSAAADIDFLSGQKHPTTIAPKANVATPPSEDIRQQAAAWAAATDHPADLVVVGHAGPLHRMDAVERHVFYREYARELARLHAGAVPKLSEPEFVAAVGGWSTIETFGIGGFVKVDYPMAVSVADVDKVTFPATLRSMVTGAQGDLIASRPDANGVLTIARLLCQRDAANARQCGESYEPGRYDARSGAELDGDLKPKADGKREDVASYVVQPATGR
jgi:hypothetical protein